MTPSRAGHGRTQWWHDARAIAQLAWPVLVGQVAVLGFSTIDTVLTARSGAEDLAALAVGMAAYFTIFIGLMGTVAALSPLVGQHHGAGDPLAAGHQLHQAMWLALGLSVPGCALLLWPEPFLVLSQVTPAVATKVRGYLAWLALALPAALLFGAYRGFNTAVARPKAVMLVQLAGFALKLPLSAALIFGVGTPAEWLHLPALGAVGAALATAVVMWAQLLAALWCLRQDPFYAPFAPPGRHALQPPQRQALQAQLRLGLPIAASMLIEATGFSFMAVFIARLGTQAVAGHQIAANVTALLFMLPLALGQASSALVAQAVGARRLDDARRLGWHGLELGVALAMGLALLLWLASPWIVALYSRDPAVGDVALPLLAWVALFHIADAGQVIAAFVLRAWRIATVPMLIYALAVWGVGLGGGYGLALSGAPWVPAALQGARGFWAAATVGLVMAALALAGWLLRTLRRVPACELNPAP